MKKAHVAHSRSALGLVKHSLYFNFSDSPHVVPFAIDKLGPGETVVLEHLFARCDHEDCFAAANPWMMFRCAEASLARGEKVRWNGIVPKGFRGFRTWYSSTFDLLNIMFNYMPVAEVLKDPYAMRISRSECTYEFVLGDPLVPLVSLAFVVRNPWKAEKRISFDALCSAHPVSDLKAEVVGTEYMGRMGLVDRREECDG